MTTNSFEARLVRLEQRRLPREPDPRHLEEARERALSAILGILAQLDRGEPPNNPMGYALVEHDGDVYEACMSLYERRRRGEAWPWASR